MSSPAQTLFDELAGDYLGRDGVSYGRIWHNDGLKVNGKIFAMVVRDQLVVKVPAAQARQLCESGEGIAFEPRPGRPMKEWVVIGSAERALWRDLLTNAYAYGVSLTATRA